MTSTAPDAVGPVPLPPTVRLLRPEDAARLSALETRNRDSLLIGAPERSDHYVSSEGQSQVIASLLDAAARGRGVMSAVLPLVVERTLGPRSRTFADGSRGLGLHRLEAGCRPDNPASARVLEKAGFREYGYAERYLRLGGRWHDHRLFELLNDDWEDVAADLPR